VFRNILAAIDSSPTSQRALATAGELATELNARLTVISVARGVPSGAYRAGVDAKQLEHDVESATEKLLREAVESLPPRLPVTTVLKHGNPGERIVEQIENGQHDLVVMGSRGRGRMAVNLFGSVAAHVFFHSHVAMLVIKPDE
jgi:nucleotide-binding universal stress UspA family protein